jgi:hypothetical protein
VFFAGFRVRGKRGYQSLFSLKRLTIFARFLEKARVTQKILQKLPKKVRLPNDKARFPVWLFAVKIPEVFLLLQMLF